MQPPSQYLFKTFDLQIAGHTIKPEYWHAGVILFLIFAIILTFARYRHLKVKWGLQGFIPTVALGFALAIILEAAFILSGRTLLTEILGWENAPKPISTAIDESRKKMVNVLGVTEEIPDTYAGERSTPDEMILLYTSLDQQEAEKVRSIICEQ